MQYDDILYHVTNKYHEVYTSLFEFNDDILDENLLHYLFTDSYVILLEYEGDVNIFSGYSSTLYGRDIYGNVSKGMARPMYTAMNPTPIPFDKNNSVVVYSNRLRLPMKSMVYELLTELASTYYIMQNNLRLSNITTLINATPSTASTMEKVLHEMLLTPKSVTIVKDKENLKKDIDVFNLNIKYMAMEYAEEIIFLHNQILEIFGIDFTPITKKERVNTEEVKSNNNLVKGIKSKTERAFNRYLKRANELFGKNFKIELHEEEEIEDPTEEPKEKEKRR